MSYFSYGEPKKWWKNHIPLDKFFSNNRMILDLTAGYRNIWREIGYMGDVLFLDMRYEVEPDVCGNNERLPFRDNIFDVVVYDPPHVIREEHETYFRTEFGKRYWAWKSVRDFVNNIKKVNVEAYRVTKPNGIMVFKWIDRYIPIDRVLVFLDKWIEYKRVKRISKSYHGNNTTYLVWLKRKD